MEEQVSLLRIKDYKKVVYIKPEKEFETGKVLLENNLVVSKAILFGIIVSKFESEKLSRITIDDFTGTTELLCFNEDKKKLEKFKEGDIVWSVCKAKESEGKPFFVVEFIKKISFMEEIVWRTKRIAFLLNNSVTPNFSESTKNSFEEESEENAFTPANKLKVTKEKI